MRRAFVFAAALLLSCAPAADMPGADAGLSYRITESIVSVGIASKVQNVLIRPMGDFSVIDQSTGEMKELKSGAQYLVEADEGNRVLIGGHLFLGPTRLLPGKPGEHVLIENRKYRGNILFKPNDDATVTVIDEMGIEEYLQGVLPKEMSPEWPLEALKAQAVVARTFTVNNLGKFARSGFDLTDDDHSQIYTGLQDVSETVNRAIRETAGEILYWDGKRVDAYFHSTCGGHTIDPKSAWGSGYRETDVPKPLRGVRDKYCRATPNYEWTAYFRSDDILTALAKHGAAAARLEAVRLGRRGSHGRAATLELTLDGERREFRAHPLRLWLGPAELKSTLIEKIERKKQGYAFYGRGYGHGVGLCQWGTRRQAEGGRDYRKILRHYFPHARIVKQEL